MAKSSQESKQRFVERATKATTKAKAKAKTKTKTKDEEEAATNANARHFGLSLFVVIGSVVVVFVVVSAADVADIIKRPLEQLRRSRQGRAPIGYINRSSRPVRVRIFSLFDRCPATFYTVGDSLTCVLTHNASARISSECECECEYECECECEHWVLAFAPCYLWHQISLMYVLIFALKASNRTENASEHIDWTQIATGYCDWHPSRFYYGCASSAIESIDTHSNCSQSVTPTEQNIDGGIWQTNWITELRLNFND